MLFWEENDNWQSLPIKIGSQKEAIMPTRNINLTEHLDQFVERQVASGSSRVNRRAVELIPAVPTVEWM